MKVNNATSSGQAQIKCEVKEDSDNSVTTTASERRVYNTRSRNKRTYAPNSGSDYNATKDLNKVIVCDTEESRSIKPEPPLEANIPDVHDRPSLSRDSIKPATSSKARKFKVGFLCVHCHIKFGSIEVVIDHMTRSHNKNPDFNCMLCSETFPDYQLLRQHFDSAHMQYEAESSDHDFSTLPEDCTSFECPTCLKVFRTRQSLHSHKLRFHDRENHVQCRLCKRNFHKNTLETHMKDCARKSNTSPIMCDQCGKTCRNRVALQSHLRYVHSKKLMKCKVCGKEFKHHNQLRLCEDKHANIRRFKCTFCPKAFFYLHSWEVHTRIHTGEKPYNCWVCDRNFYSHQTLLKHSYSHGFTRAQFQAEFKKRTGKTY